MRANIRTNSKQSMARGHRIDQMTEGIEDEDREELIGENYSVYHPNELNSTLKEYLKLEKTHFRPRTIGVVIIPFFSIILIGLLRGSKTFNSIVGIERCDDLDYLLFCAQILVLISLSVINNTLLKKEYRDKINCGYQFVKGDIIWNSKTIIKFSIIALIAGFISG